MTQNDAQPDAPLDPPAGEVLDPERDLTQAEEAASYVPAFRSLTAVLLFLLITADVLALDMALKAWSFEHVAGTPVVDLEQAADNPAFWYDYRHEPTVVIPGVLNLRLVSNTGAVFGLGKGNRWFFVLASLAAICVIGMLFARSDRRARLLHVALALVLAGALGNLYDRWFYGVVRDMLHLFPSTELWPWVFNLADVSLLCGVGLILLITVQHEVHVRRSKS